MMRGRVRSRWVGAACFGLVAVLATAAVVVADRGRIGRPGLPVALRPTASPPPAATSLSPFDGEPSASPLISLPPSPSLAKATCDAVAVPDASPAPSLPGATPAPLLQFHVPILMYHRIVSADQAGNSLEGLVVAPPTFAAQMQALADDGWHTVTLRQLAEDLVDRRTPSPKTFVVTFDDGYDDGYTNAFPVLQRFGFVGTFFVIAGRIDHPVNLTLDHLRQLAAAGNEIADHTLDHADLTHLKPLEARYEVAAGAERIAEATGQWPSTFAYPYGRSNAAAVAAVASCPAMLMAVTTAPGASESWANRLEVPRVRVGPATTPAGLLSTLLNYEKQTH